MTERYCDALIIGTDIPGLIAAAFLARRGLGVQVIDPSPYTQSEFKPDPYPVGHLHSKLLRSILGRLNVSEAEIQSLSPHDDPLQIIFNNKRIDISPNPALFYDEIDREFPEDKEAIKQFYERLTHAKHEIEIQHLYDLFLPNTFMERRQLNKFVRQHQLEESADKIQQGLRPDIYLSSFFQTQLRLLLQTHKTRGEFAFNVAELLNPNEGEILFLCGGQNRLKKIFLERIRHHEGSVREEAHLERLLYKNGIFEGAQLTGSQGQSLARYVIWNTDLERLLEYLPSQFRYRKIRRAVRHMKPKFHWFTAYFQVPRRFIPPPMKSQVILVDDPGKALCGSNYVYLQLLDDKNGLQVIAANYLLEPKALEADEESFTPIHDKISRQIGRILPFANNQLELIFPLGQAPQQKDTLFPLKENDFEVFKHGAKIHPVYEIKGHSFMELFPLSFKTPSPNFFLTSQQILSAMGYEGKFMLGLQVTDLIWQDVEKEKKRAMKLEKRIA